MRSFRSSCKTKSCCSSNTMCFILTFQALSYYGNGTEAWRHSYGMTNRLLILSEKLSQALLTRVSCREKNSFTFVRCINRDLHTDESLLKKTILEANRNIRRNPPRKLFPRRPLSRNFSLVMFLRLYYYNIP